MEPTPQSGQHRLTRTIRRRRAEASEESSWQEALADEPEVLVAATGLHSVVALDEQRIERRTGCDEVVGEEGRYVPGDAVGESPLATVYEVFDRSLERPVAVKIIRPDYADDPAAIREFLREARVLAALDHPVIPPVYDVGVDASGAVYMTMKLLAGRSLGRLLERPEVAAAYASDPDAAVRLFITIAEGLAAAHERGLVHQDVKPEHIVLGEHGAAFLTGWGVALATGGWGASGRDPVAGTPAFMAPEQARRERADVRSDVYGLAASLLYALSGCYPAWSDDERVFWYKKREGLIDDLPPERARALPDGLVAIIRRGLAVQADRRQADAGIFAAELREFQARRGRHLARQASRARRRRAFAGLALVAATVLAAGAILAWRAWQRATTWQPLYVQDFDQVAIEDLRADWVLYRRHGGNPSDQWEQLRWTGDAPWAIADGRLVGFAPGAVEFSNIGFARPIAGNIRVEWTVTPLTSNQNLNCFIAADRRDRGYTFHIGGWGDPAYMVLTKGPSFEIIQNRFDVGALEVGTSYRFRMQREGRRVRLWIDDQQVFDHQDLDLLTGPANRSFGFEVSTQNRIAIDDLVVSNQPLPATLTAIQLADALADNGNHEAALAHYEAIYRERDPATPAAGTALYKIALSHAGAGRPEQGWQLLRRFEQEYPDHELLPQARYHRSQLAARVDRPEQETVLLELMAAEHPGHPVLRNVLSAKSLAYARKLEKGPIVSLEDNGYPMPIPELQAQVVDEVADLVAWARRCGLSTYQNSFLRRSQDVLGLFGRDQVLREVVPPDSRVAYQIARRSGDFAAALSHPRITPAMRADILFDMGRYDDALAELGPDEPGRWRIHAVRGDSDAALDAVRGLPALRQTVLETQGLHQRLLDEYGDDPKARFAALLALGRPQEVLADPLAADGGKLVARARLQLGLIADPAEIAPDDKELAYRWAIKRWAAGDVAAARTLIDRLAPHEFQDWGELLFAHRFLPAVFAGLEGDRATLERRLRHQLETFPRAWAGRVGLWAGYLLEAPGHDDRRVAAQALGRVAVADLALLQGLRADLAGDAATAVAAYRRFLAAHPLERSDSPTLLDFLDVRLAVLDPP